MNNSTSEDNRIANFLLNTAKNLDLVNFNENDLIEKIRILLKDKNDDESNWASSSFFIIIFL